MSEPKHLVVRGEERLERLLARLLRVARRGVGQGRQNVERPVGNLHVALGAGQPLARSRSASGRIHRLPFAQDGSRE
jgi:hypothetical protein